MRYDHECQECGQRLGWDAVWVQTHSEEYHQRRSAALYGAASRLLDRYLNLRVKEAQEAVQGLVVIHTVSRVYQGLRYTSTVTRMFWDELDSGHCAMDRNWLLRHLRENASEGAKREYGVDVNPATWKQRTVEPPRPTLEMQTQLDNLRRHTGAIL